ncbi:MAG TPA: anaerobic ribonucleoside-triphosphate reductase activating protein [Deltaproteobacteria bacterium]|nr:MAG: anaerobic ribonucleoside-triphosphate reductase activating protein [Deltaproteobacteria bacterium RIFCSPLOWO2_02_FULL_42_39]OGQ65650.1 MAG: anaerobic ribonucleoside-triphosphate reductase activating protein [Deltaproteobacteria bacterium RIFCSPLOWO2_12_FULL_42_16]HAG52015.1 anaerobic ribonucleoside-triphosphate reductase activating protein [Deltaproteobacteria bacterium]HCY18733.1 anaerobic ribonucleoside-triphosphate reductase activating protein [Deltaproteobacteria bacterium]
MSNETHINIHSIIPLSKINGPGKRMVIFFQGCNKRCHGCFNPATHSFDTVTLHSPEDILKKSLLNDIEGITVSGGEPFLQHNGLFELLKMAKNKYNLTTVVYTGFTYEELKENAYYFQCLDFIDVLVDGRYDETKKEPTLLARGSTNQRFYFISNRYTEKDFYMPGKTEIIIGKNGVIKATGFGKPPHLAPHTKDFGVRAREK